MVDIAFDPEVMIYLRQRPAKPLSFIWIDHHKSAIMDSIKHNYQGMAGTRDMKFAACELTWKYFFPDEEMPELVRLLGRYDCFGHKGTAEEQKVLEFQYGARSCMSNYNECYRILENSIAIEKSAQNAIQPILDTGKAIYKYLCTEAKQIYAKGFPVEYEGYNFIMFSRERFNPINFGIDYHKDGYDGAGCFWYDGMVWTFSLYNDNGKVDVSEICKIMGGGGHPGAAGYTSEDFTIVSPKP